MQATILSEQRIKHFVMKLQDVENLTNKAKTVFFLVLGIENYGRHGLDYRELEEL